MDILYCLTADAAELTDNEISALVKFLVKECNNRYIDIEELIEEADQEIVAEYNAEEEYPDYIGVDKTGW